MSAPSREPLKEEFEHHLRELSKALDRAFISTWQSTAAWQKELDAALEFLSRVDAHRDNQ